MIPGVPKPPMRVRTSGGQGMNGSDPALTSNRVEWSIAPSVSHVSSYQMHNQDEQSNWPNAY